MIGLIAKAIAAAVVAALTSAVTALNDNGNITLLEWVAIASAFLVTGGATWAIPNIPESVRRYGKAITAGVVSGLGSLAVALTDGGIAQGEWLTIVVAVVGGLGLVYATPNATVSDEFRGIQGTRVLPHH